ncbi:MAG: high-potential iron-sulfur protein [Rubrivivax sp.]|jgi:hypothetical protein|nr:high-potential iron-sulfur protein [Rubrivivax sp.]
MTNRRRFIALVPFAGVTLLAACSKEGSSSTTASAPAPAPLPSTPAPSAAPAPSSADLATPGSANLPLLQESEPVAAGLGYVSVASRVDSVKYKKYAAGQVCGNCQLYGAKAGDAQGPCPIFAGKQVLATGWCSAYAKKVG